MRGPYRYLARALCDLASSGTCYRNEAGTWTKSPGESPGTRAYPARGFASRLPSPTATVEREGAKRGQVVVVEHWLDEILRKARQP